MDDPTSLLETLAAHRATLRHALTQRAYFDAGHVPAQLAHTIDEQRAAIARIKRDLRAAGHSVDDEPGDLAAPEEAGPPGERLVAALALLASMPLDDVPTPAPLPRGSRMPLSPNALFVGRDAQLRTLAAALQRGSSCVIAAATGLGGVGKSQLAAEFAHRYGQYFAGGVFWLSFADPAGVLTEVAASGTGLGLPRWEALPLPEQAARVRELWHMSLPRLLVFDNCEDEALLDAWRPTSGGARVLITSRRPYWDPTLGVQALPLDVLARPQSIALLRGFRPELLAADAGLDALAAELGDLPLALHLAGSTLRRYAHALSPAQYLARLRAPDALLAQLKVEGRSPTGHEQDVARTFAASLARLDAANPADALARQLLARAAHFAPGEPIPRALLADSMALEEAAPALEKVEDALTRLIELGLLEDEASGALRLHRLLAAFARSALADAAAQAAVESALIKQAYNINMQGYPLAMQPLLAHLRHTTDSALARADAQAAVLSINLGFHLKATGDLISAQPYYEHALAINQQVLGAHHPETAKNLNNLGTLLQDMGDLEAASWYLEQALAITRTVLGERHPATALILNNLGGLSHHVGDLEAARIYYAQALEIKRAVLGERHPDTATSLNNLGALLKELGDLEAARAYLEQALDICRAVLGERHPDTARSLNNLGMLLQDMGNLAGARAYLEQALDIWRAVLGERHPATATSLNNLGMLLQDMGDLAGARAYYEQALAIRRDVLGERHPDTARSLNNLGSLLQAQGDLAGARRYYEQVLDICRAVLGERHPATALSLNNLGGLLQAQGDLVGARAYYEQALAILIDTLGPEHPTTQIVRRNLAALGPAAGEAEPDE